MRAFVSVSLVLFELLSPPLPRLLDSVPLKVERKESRRASHVLGPTPRFSIDVNVGCKNGLLMLEQYCTLSGELTDVSDREGYVYDGEGDIGDGEGDVSNGEGDECDEKGDGGVMLVTEKMRW